MSCSTLNRLKPGVAGLVCARATSGAHSTRALASRTDGTLIVLFIFLSPCGGWPGRSQARLPSEPDGHMAAGAQFDFLALVGQHDAGAGRPADEGPDGSPLPAFGDGADDGPGAGPAPDDHGVPLVAVASGDVDRPRADGVLLALQDERVEVEGE